MCVFPHAFHCVDHAVLTARGDRMCCIGVGRIGTAAVIAASPVVDVARVDDRGSLLMDTPRTDDPTAVIAEENNSRADMAGDVCTCVCGVCI